MPDVPAERFRKFAIAVVVATLGVIVWGAYVRATGSGAGCGSHWPLCNGEVIPRSPTAETVIEFTHRATSGIAFLMVVAQTVWAFRAFPRRHLVRRAAAATMVLMVTEALVGAGLVIFEMVAGNGSVARAAWMGAHLVNTFALLAAMGVTVWAAGPRAAAVASPPRQGALVLGGLVLALAVALTGAIAALGDTLFPASSLAEGLRQDLAPGAHVFVRLRMLHPILAVVAGLYLAVCAVAIASDGRTAEARRLATVLGVLVLAQMAVGITNMLLLAPVALQLVHLLVADLLWLTLVALTATVRQRGEASAAVPAATRNVA